MMTDANTYQIPSVRLPANLKNDGTNFGSCGPRGWRRSSPSSVAAAMAHFVTPSLFDCQS